MAVESGERVLHHGIVVDPWFSVTRRSRGNE
jgi:hypothetical protein